MKHTHMVSPNHRTDEEGIQSANSFSKTELKHGATAEAGAHALNLRAVLERCGLPAVLLPVPVLASDE